MALAAGELEAAFAALGVVAGIAALDEITGVRKAGGALYVVGCNRVVAAAFPAMVRKSLGSAHCIHY